MKAYNRKRKPKHMVVRHFKLFVAGDYELYYYDRFKKSSRTLVDSGYTTYAIKIQEEKIRYNEVLNMDWNTF